ncbi:hypothetical protein [Galactobacter valiniphilus]|uniref:hypothetical protein n=1 Tax=Galactobacter valiniphilus TaxID=2676122 RepID=UPI003736CC7A
MEDAAARERLAKARASVVTGDGQVYRGTRCTAEFYATSPEVNAADGQQRWCRVVPTNLARNASLWLTVWGPEKHSPGAQGFLFGEQASKLLAEALSASASAS